VTEASPPRPAAAGWLIAVDGAPVHHAIEQLPFRIGRSIGNDLVLSDPSVSRYHAEVDLRPDGGIAITDLDSLNGVYLGGKRVTHARLFDGCRIEIGDVVFQYTRDPPAVAEGGTLVLAATRRRRS
jgi:pSer/pThr/pTyr-binding forkhead associated (FHA) protein